METARSESRFAAVALDMMGVVHPIGDDLREIVMPFLRERGCRTPDEAIIAAYRHCYRGGADVRSFWRAAGLNGQDGLEDELLSLYELSPGVIAFLEKLTGWQLPVFALSNDIAEWSLKRRQALCLVPFFKGWVVSGEYGIPKPQPGIYQILASMLSCTPSQCLFVDDRQANLDGAAAAGFSTVLFGAESTRQQPAVQDFDELAKFVAIT